MWKRQQAELAFRWGTYELQTDQFLEDPRPAYKVMIFLVFNFCCEMIT